jgi:hypothetical protein
MGPTYEQGGVPNVPPSFEIAFFNEGTGASIQSYDYGTGSGSSDSEGR